MADSPADDRRHVVHVGPGGTFRRSGQYHSTPDEVAEIVDSIEAEGVGRVVLHLHGGLVGEGGGLRTAETLTSVYRRADAHPVFLVWETGLATTVRDNLAELGGTKLFRKVVTYAIRHAARYLGASVPGRGAGELMTLAEAEALWENQIDIVTMDEGARSAVGAGSLEEWELERPIMEVEVEQDVAGDPEIEEIELEGPGTDLATLPEPPGDGRLLELAAVAKVIAGVIHRVVRRFLTDRDHGLVPTVVEEALRGVYLADLGRWAWSGMKDKATDMWLPNSVPVGEDDHVGTHLLDLLADLQARTGVEVHLVGHSAGSIAICGLLTARRARHPGLHVDSIAFLAPAVRADVFVEQLEAGDMPRVRAYPMRDDAERMDPIAGRIYPLSLLYFIAGCLEDDDGDTQLVGLHRHLAGTKPYHEPPASTVATWLGARDSNRLVTGPTDDTAGVGLGTTARRHADFDEDAATQESLVAWILETG